MTCFALMLLGGYAAEAQTNRESRAIKKENRKALRAEYKQRTRGQTQTRINTERMERQNYKQIKKMERAARKQNRGRRYDANTLGGVFDGM
ncbi:MAG: hypothetical protein K0R82_1896 [Flavipsychrobacter sp.]|jgi:hypothetical protein|nr:hypothetical protein [Flavipsychrobacter sp.]